MNNTTSITSKNLISNRSFKIILIGSVVLVIIVFCGYNYFEYRKQKKLNDNSLFPPWPSKCPDYWKVGKTGECININRLGKCFTGNSISDQTMNFNQPEFKGNRGMYNKCIWALPQNCNTPWEGIDSLCV